MKSTLLATALTLFASGAMANPEVIAWHASLSSAFSKCETQMDIAHMYRRLKGSSDEGRIFQPTRECVSESLIDAKNLTQCVLSQKLSPKVEALVKDYYATWAAGMKGVPGLLPESDASARNAAIQIKSSLNKAWTLIELELDS